MQKAKVIGGLISILVTFPIWVFLLYTILSAINANQLTWLLFWAYVPLGILIKILTEVAAKD